MHGIVRFRMGIAHLDFFKPNLVNFTEFGKILVKFTKFSTAEQFGNQNLPNSVKCYRLSVMKFIIQPIFGKI